VGGEGDTVGGGRRREEGGGGAAACPLLLVAVGGEPSDEAASWKHGLADRHPAAAEWIGGAAASKWVESRLTKESGPINRVRIGKLLFFLRLEGAERALPGPPEPLED